MPVPLSEFVDNGWKVVRQSGAIASGGTGNVTLEKDGKKMDVDIANGADYQTTPINCAVYRIVIEDTDNISIKLPGEIGIGTSKADVDSVISVDKNDNIHFYYYEGSSWYSYSYSEVGNRDFKLDIYVDVNTRQVNKISMNNKTWRGKQ